jgi:hypothetical protein
MGRCDTRLKSTRPFLEGEDILAALDYAAHQTDHVVLST